MSSKLPDGYKSRFTQIKEVSDGWVDHDPATGADYDQSADDTPRGTGFRSKSKGSSDNQPHTA